MPRQVLRLFRTRDSTKLTLCGEKEGRKMNPLIQLKTTAPLLIALALLGLALSPKAQAVVPAPDGGYPGGNTAEGQRAVLSLTIGIYNTAVGVFFLLSLTDGQFNTATGAGALGLGNTGDSNTAIGSVALQSSDTNFNTAVGFEAIVLNTTGADNIAIGAKAGHLSLQARDRSRRKSAVRSRR
jgi:hypothetical protein